jgi:hypothetical protein
MRAVTLAVEESGDESGGKVTGKVDRPKKMGRKNRPLDAF